MTSTLMTRVTKDLVRTLGDMSPAPADSDFTDAWDRHIDTLRQCAIRLQRDFDMPDTADLADRHLELYIYVNRAARLLTDARVPAQAETILKGARALVDEVDDPVPLMEYLLSAPTVAIAFAEYLGRVVGRPGRSCQEALRLLARDGGVLQDVIGLYGEEAA